jgi:hypothetical protein
MLRRFLWGGQSAIPIEFDEGLADSYPEERRGKAGASENYI